MFLKKDSTGNGWTQRGSTLSQTGGFGHSVALSKYDGNILVCGAPFYNTVTPPSSAYSVTGISIYILRASFRR